MQASLFLIPVPLGDTAHARILPPYNREVIIGLRHFIVENVRTARRFLKRTDVNIDLDGITFYELNKHTLPEEAASYLAPLAKGEAMGVLSEAGCPAVADPGADVVAMAQERGFAVVPLVGPSSILLALMASGFNGQCFAFHGYLPIDNAARIQAIRRLEGLACAGDQTQILIETPYRNDRLAEDILRTCRPTTRLCIASDISCDNESIRTRSIREWQGRLPSLNHHPTVFLLYK